MGRKGIGQTEDGTNRGWVEQMMGRKGIGQTEDGTKGDGTKGDRTNR